MTVRRMKRRDKTGVQKVFWMIDVQFTHPDGRVQRIRKVSPVQTRRGAEAYERELRAALLSGQHGRKEAEPPPKLKDFATEFLSTYAQPHNKASEVKGKECMLRLHLVPAFGELRLDQVSVRRIDEFKAKQVAKGLNNNTINKQLTLLRTMLSVAQDWKLIDSVPKVKKLAAIKPKYDFLDFDEADRLIDAAVSEPTWHSMIVVALNTGLRLGELLALEWDDVDLVAGRMTVRHTNWQGTVGTPKGGKEKTVPLNTKVVTTLKGHRHLCGALVWCREDGRTLHKDHMAAALNRIRKRAGLRKIGWHVLRHTFASHLVMLNVPLKAVQELMRHQSIEMTMRYAHLTPGTRSAAVQVLVNGPVKRGTYAATRQPKNKTATQGDP